MKKVIAAHHGLEREQLIITNGGDELITLISEAFLNPGVEAVVPEPSFSEYRFGALLMEASVKRVPLRRGYLYDTQGILDSLTDRTKMVYICSPNNPTGTFMTTRELQILLDALPKRVLVVIDAAYSHYASSED